jgi:heterodisulfide reductase subunit A-like polyferredoxin
MPFHTGYLPTYRLQEHSSIPHPWPEASVSNHDFTTTAVVIIGGGIAGMCTAIDLLVNRKVKNFVILEKSGGFGGTWWVRTQAATQSKADMI